MVQTTRLSNQRLKVINDAADLMDQGKVATALNKIKNSFGTNTDTFRFFKGWQYYLMSDHKRAIENWEEALQLNPANTDVLNYLTNAYLEIGMLSEAEVCARSALMLPHGDKVTAYKLLIQVLFAKGTTIADNEEQQNLEEALSILSTLIEEDIGDPLDHKKQIGATLLALHKFDLALKFMLDVLEQDPHDAFNLRNIAAVYTNTGRPKEAIPYLDKINGTLEQNIDAQYQKGMLQLKLGDYENGWKNHEQRLRSLKYSRKFVLDKFPQLSRYEESHYEHILVFQEQGIGDALQMSRYLPALREYVNTINEDCRIDLAVDANIFNPRASIKDFMQLNYSDVVDDFFEIDDLEKNYSSCISLFSLPHFLRMGNNVPKQTKFITDVSIPGPNSGKKNIGIFWRGSEFNQFNELRSMTDYQVRQLLDDEHNWVPLQLKHFPSTMFDKMPVDSLTELAATIQTLDLVITVDSMVGHLAAGMGVETWIMLSYASDWRWGLPNTPNRWYDNVKLFRQDKWRGWNFVISQIKAELKT